MGVSSALAWLGGAAIIGAGIGALSLPTDRARGALGGAESGLALVGIGGLVVAIFSPKSREAGLATAGIGLGGLALLGIAMSIVSPTSTTITTGMGRPLLPLGRPDRGLL